MMLFSLIFLAKRERRQGKICRNLTEDVRARIQREIRGIRRFETSFGIKLRGESRGSTEFSLSRFIIASFI